MSRKRAQIRSHQARGTFRQPATVAAVFLGLHILLLFWRPNPMWGADLLFYMPAPVQGIFVLLAVLLFIPGFRGWIRSLVCALPFTLWGEGRRVWITRGLVLLIALAAFVVLHSALHILGDGSLYIRELDAGNWRRDDRAPLTFTLIRSLHRIGDALWQTAENTYRVYSYVSGLLYILLAFCTASTLGINDREKSVVFAFLVTPGYVQLFFGYVENYALYMPASLLYLLAGLRCMENRVPLFVPALVLGLFITFHFVFIVFSPSLLILGYYSYRRARSSKPRWNKTLATSAAVCTTPLTVLILLWATRFDLVAFLERAGASNHILPLVAAPGFEAPYRLASVSHLLDFINLQILSAPAALMVLFLLAKKDFCRHPFLLAASAFPVLFSFITNPAIGTFRDWDILAFSALPLSLWIASAFLERSRRKKLRFRNISVIFGAAALHTLLWIGVNADSGAAEARYAQLMSRLSGYAASYGWETLGTQYRLQGRTVPALNAYKRALEADPRNPRHWVHVGRIFCLLGQSQRGIDHLKRATEIRPEFAEAYISLGNAYLQIDRLALAIVHYKKAIEIQPDLAVSYMNLGAAYIKTGKLDKAVEVLNKSVQLNPDHPHTHLLLSLAYRSLNLMDEAKAHYEMVLKLKPDDPHAARIKKWFE